MKIAESAIQLYSERSFIENHTSQESLTVWKAGDENRVSSNNAGASGPQIDVQKHLSIISEATKVELSEQAISSRSVSSVDELSSENHEIMMDLNIRILKAMIERLTGKRVRLASTESLQSTNENPEQLTAKSGGEVVQGEAVEAPAPTQGGLIYDYYESHYESEATSFAANGTLLTEDGKEIQFSVDLNMSREFFSEERISIRAGDALKDPLVINFSGSAAELTDTKFSFDIDNDGHENQISFLKPGSGFLALDNNNDGTINDGSELFGPQSGNGFSDLAAHDSDGNNWIDENDSIYNKLRIWTKDAEGNDTLFALGEKGIGAIYLGSAATVFSINDNKNDLLGEVQSTGVFVKENGGVGTVQQINLVA